MLRIPGRFERTYNRARALDKPIEDTLVRKFSFRRSRTVGPYIIFFVFVIVLVGFAPIFLLEQISKHYKWELHTHDTVYGIYVAVLALIIVGWSVKTIIAIVREQKEEKLVNERYKKTTKRN